MKSIRKNFFKETVSATMSHKFLRKIAVKQLDKQLHKAVMDSSRNLLYEEKVDQYHFLSSLLGQARQNLEKGFISPNVLLKMIGTLVKKSYNPDRHAKLNPVKEAYKNKYGEYPPQFLTLSPGKGCNLHCTGCYASSDISLAEKLDFETSRRILQEAHDIFGTRFMVISGGEPFMYKSHGKTILDLFEEFNDIFFLVYTNGTLINEEMARKLANLGNVTPAISVEGFEKETDERRGKGIHKKILRAMNNLKKEGIPFGISVTATSMNAEILMQDEFYDFFFNEVGATYMWQFQLMPIGRAKDTRELMITPRQRVKLYKKWEHLLSEKKYPVADFWNSSSLSSGCIAYGRWGGYFYIDWNGNVMPCVFVPYHVDNINDVYQNGGTLADVVQSKFFKNGRKWQREYGFENEDFQGNLLMPCSIRDHYENFKNNILTPDAKGEDELADAILTDPEYEKMMKEFDEELTQLTEGIFRSKYLKEEAVNAMA